MTGWELVRFLHLAGMAFFVGGQLMLVAVVAPAIRRHGTDAAMRTVARRFGMGSGVALLVLVGVLLGVHVVRPRSRWLSLATLVASLAIVWLGVELAHG